MRLREDTQQHIRRCLNLCVVISLEGNTRKQQGRAARGVRNDQLMKLNIQNHTHSFEHLKITNVLIRAHSATLSPKNIHRNSAIYQSRHNESITCAKSYPDKQKETLRETQLEIDQN